MRPPGRIRAVTAAAVLAVALVSACSDAPSADPGPRGQDTVEPISTPAAPSAPATENPTTTTSAPAPSSSTSSARDRAVRITAVGDVIMGAAPELPPDEGRGLFAAVEDLIVGDVVLANLDQALTEGGTSKCGAGSSGCYAFRTPPSYARWLAEAGFTVVNLANNHTRDFGETGLADTREALEAAGLRPTGLPGQIAYQEVDGVRVAVVGFAPYGWTQSLLDIPAAEQLVREADSEADLVVVTIHAGAEGTEYQHTRPGTEIFLGEDRGDPIRFSHAVIDAGADAVLGAGPHVLRGMEWYQGRLIAYSLGNFMGYRALSNDGPKGVGAILTFELEPDGSWAGGRLLATRMVDPGLPEPDPGRRAVAQVRALSAEDFGTCAVDLGAAGRIRDPAC